MFGWIDRWLGRLCCALDAHSFDRLDLAESGRKVRCRRCRRRFYLSPDGDLVRLDG